MRAIRGLTGYSSTGMWVVRSGETRIGPFDGRTPAKAWAKKARDLGFEAKAEPLELWSPREAEEAMMVRKEDRSSP